MHYRFLLAAFLVATTASLTAQSTNASFELAYGSYPNSTVVNGGIVQGDFNSDGKPDMVFAAGGPGDNANVSYLVIQLGNGDGTFQPPQTLAPIGELGGEPADLVAADMNSDGKLDVVTFNGQGAVDVFYGNGNGIFQAPVTFSAAHQPTSITVGDFYRNGLLDIAVGDLDGYVEIWKNVGGKSFVPGSVIAVAPGTTFGTGSVIVSAGNVDGNGNIDIAVMSYSSNGTNIIGNVNILWGDGHGNFKSALLKSSYPFPSDLKVVKLAQDGRADVLVSYNCNPLPPGPGKGPSSYCAGFDAFYGQGNNKTFYRHLVSDSGDSALDFWAVDVNGDGIADIAASGETSGSQDGLFIWFGHPDGSFDQTPQRLIANTENANGMVPGDWNRDGKIDFVQIMDGLAFYLNASNQTPCVPSQINPAVTTCQPVDNTYLPSPVNIVANAYDQTPVTALQEYADGKLVYSDEMSSFNISLPESLGPHFLVTKAWDAKGVSFRSDRNITVYSGTPGAVCNAAPDSASICLPAGSSSSSPVHILANGYAPKAVPTAAQLYIDGKLAVNDRGLCYQGGFCVGGTSYVDTYQSLPSGSHQLEFKLWDADGNVYTAQKNITVN